MNGLWKKFINKVRLNLLYENNGNEILEVLEKLSILNYAEENYDEGILLCKLKLEYNEKKYVIYRYAINDFVDMWHTKIDGVVFEGNVLSQIIGTNNHSNYILDLIDEFIKLLHKLKKQNN